MTRILIVDDQLRFRATARRWLARGGFDVVGEAADGADALEAAARLRPDVVLLDVQLPDTDGFEIAAQLALSGDSPSVVLTSSRAAADYGDLVARSGAPGVHPEGRAVRAGAGRALGLTRVRSQSSIGRYRPSR